MKDVRGQGNRLKIGISIVIVSIICLIIKTAVNLLYKAKNTIDKQREELNRFYRYDPLLEQWLDLKIKGKNIETYFKQNDFKTIAVYGMGNVGRHFCNELKESSVVEIKYGIDKAFGSNKVIVDLKNLTDEVIPVDAVIVTAVRGFDVIKKELEDKYKCPIISLEDVIYSI